MVSYLYISLSLSLTRDDETGEDNVAESEFYYGLSLVANKCIRRCCDCI